jgi:hypothetical protein
MAVLLTIALFGGGPATGEVWPAMTEGWGLAAGVSNSAGLLWDIRSGDGVCLA